jgi:hypothetical protein
MKYCVWRPKFIDIEPLDIYDLGFQVVVIADIVVEIYYIGIIGANGSEILIYLIIG